MPWPELLNSRDDKVEFIDREWAMTPCLSLCVFRKMRGLSKCETRALVGSEKTFGVRP